MYRSSLADRSARLDPGAGGTIIVTPVDRAVCVMTGAGARTLETAANLGVGTEILLISQTDAIVVNGLYLNDGEWAKLVVSVNASGTNTWKTISAETAGVINQTVDLLDARVHDAMLTRLTAGAGATDDFGVTLGGIGAARDTLNALLVGAGPETFESVSMVKIPQNYVQGDVLYVRVQIDENVASAGATTIDLSAYRTEDAATDICATAAQSIIGATSTVYTFTLTSTGTQPGELLALHLTMSITAAAAERGDYEVEEIRLTT